MSNNNEETPPRIGIIDLSPTIDDRGHGIESKVNLILYRGRNMVERILDSTYKYKFVFDYDISSCVRRLRRLEYLRRQNAPGLNPQMRFDYGKVYTFTAHQLCHILPERIANEFLDWVNTNKFFDASEPEEENYTFRERHYPIFNSLSEFVNDSGRSIPSRSSVQRFFMGYERAFRIKLTD